MFSVKKGTAAIVTTFAILQLLSFTLAQSNHSCTFLYPSGSWTFHRYDSVLLEWNKPSQGYNLSAICQDSSMPPRTIPNGTVKYAIEIDLGERPSSECWFHVFCGKYSDFDYCNCVSDRGHVVDPTGNPTTWSLVATPASTSTNFTLIAGINSTGNISVI